MVDQKMSFRSACWGVLVLAFFTFCFLSGKVYAAPDLYVGFQESSGSSVLSAAPGSTVHVSVMGDFNQAVHSVQFTLSFDPTVLQEQSVSLPSSGSPNSSTWYIVSNPNNSAGTVTVGLIDTPPNGGTSSPISGQAREIAVITFSVVGSVPQGYISPNSPNVTFISNSTPSLPSSPASVYFDNNQVTQLTGGTFSLAISSLTFGQVLGKGSITYADVVAARQRHLGIPVPGFINANALIDNASGLPTFAFVTLLNQYWSGVITLNQLKSHAP